MIIPLWFLGTVALLFGITIGSFLNAVIYRLPRGLTLLEPKHSLCPRCRHTLGPLDLVPLLSFLMLGRKCRYCKAPISWRYFGVELLTGVLFTITALHFAPQWANMAAMLAFTATLIPVFFIDLDTFTIPDSLNILLFLIPLARDIYGIVKPEPGHALLWGFLPVSLWGALFGALIFGAVRVLGWLWKGVEAMGLGDVLLGRGMGAMLACLVLPGQDVLRLLPIWTMLSCFAGIMVGPILIKIRRSKETGGAGPAVSEEAQQEAGGREGSLLGELGSILWCLVLGDLWAYLLDLAKRAKGEKSPPVVEEEWVPAATAIPFGPFLVVGFLLTVFWGEPITAAYLAYAFGKR